MFTPQQFHQLAAAAWSGPAATIQASAYTCQLAGSQAAIYYSATYTVAGVQFTNKPAAWGCPFEAICGALVSAQEGGILSAAAANGGILLVTRAQQAFANQPAHQGPVTCAPARVAAPRLFSARAKATCLTCHQAPDHFQQCGCAYVHVPASRYFHE